VHRVDEAALEDLAREGLDERNGLSRQVRRKLSPTRLADADLEARTRRLREAAYELVAELRRKLR